MVRRLLSVRSAYRPFFDHTGLRVGFISDVSGVPQVWVWEDGRLDQLTPFEERVWSASFSPSRDQLAFSMDEEGNELSQVYLLERSRLLRVTEEGTLNYLGPWSWDGRLLAFTSNARDESVLDAYAVDASTGEVRMLARGEGWCFAEAWLPGVEALVVNEMVSSSENRVYLVWRSSVREIVRHEGEAYIGSVRAAPDGRSLYLVTDLGGEYRYLARYDLERDLLKPVYAPRWDVEIVEVSQRGDVAFTVNADGYSRLYLLVDDRPVEVWISEGVVDGLAWSWDGRLAFSLTSPRRPSAVYLVEDGGARRIVEPLMMGLREVELSAPELRRFKSHDGLQVPLYLYRPRSGEPPYPTVMWVHGGPEAQARPRFTRLIQALVLEGFAVLAPNVRGSTGYGRTYAHLDDVENRFDALRDLHELARWAVEGGLSRPGLGIVGASYGGYSTLAALAFFPEDWGAGVSIVGISSLVTFLRNTGPWRRRHREREYGSLERHRELLERLSPINYVDRIKAPLLLIHGRNDVRVPVAEALQMYERLKVLGGEVELLILEDEGHTISKQRNKVRAYARAVDFMKRHLLSSA